MTHIPGPTARVTEMLGFGQIGLATSQLPLRFPCSGTIRYRSNELDSTRFISRRASHGTDILHRAIRHQQPVFMIEIPALAARVIDGLLHSSAIFRMGALDYAFHGRPRLSVQLEYPKRFIGPEDFSSGSIPPK